MARVDDLVSQVGDRRLRAHLVEALKELRRKKKFGLVYEEHVPETALLASHVGLRSGAEVIVRTEPTSREHYVVERVSKDKAILQNGTSKRTVKTADLLVVKPFGEAVYPVLRLGEDPVVRSSKRPFHTVMVGCETRIESPGRFASNDVTRPSGSESIRTSSSFGEQPAA